MANYEISVFVNDNYSGEVEGVVQASSADEALMMFVGNRKISKPFHKKERGYSIEAKLGDTNYEYHAIKL